MAENLAAVRVFCGSSPVWTRALARRLRHWDVSLPGAGSASSTGEVASGSWES